MECSKIIRRLLDVGAKVHWVFFNPCFRVQRSNRGAKESIFEEERAELGEEVGVIEFLEPNLRGRTKE